MRAPWILALLVVPVLAGCASNAPASDPSSAPARTVAASRAFIEQIAAGLGTPIEMEHDHREAAAHVGGRNLELVSWNPLGVELGQNGFANFVFLRNDREDLALIAVDGDSTGGFVIADISDPANVTALGRYMINGNNVQEVRVVPGGEFAVMNVQTIPNAGDPAAAMDDCGVCLHVVDIRDRTNPELVSLFPIEVLGTHNMDVVEIDGAIYVFHVGQPLTNHPPGNYVGVLRFVEAPEGAYLVRVAEYYHDDAWTDTQRSFPHDVLVQEHPLTQQRLAYISHWQGGALVVDVSNPLAPMEIGLHEDPAPSDVSNIHWIMQEERPREDGRVIAWSAPEIGQLRTGSGLIRAYDVTAPAEIDQIGYWELPGNVTIPSRYLMSPHVAVPDLGRGLLAVSHYHAGVWILDITDPTNPLPTAYYFPVGDGQAVWEGPIWWKKPNFSPDGFLPNVYMARWHEPDGLLWVSERGTGLYALNYTGPVPGPV